MLPFARDFQTIRIDGFYIPKRSIQRILAKNSFHCFEISEPLRIRPQRLKYQSFLCTLSKVAIIFKVRQFCLKTTENCGD